MSFSGSGLEASPLLLALLGVAIGILGGAFGVGGSFIAGPALYLIGMPLHYVVGTDLAHIAGKSFPAVREHHALGNVDFKVAAVMIPPTLAGVEVGARVLVWLHESGKIDIVAWTYAVLLASLGVGIFIEGLHARKKAEPRRGRSPVDRRGMILLVALVGLASGFMGGLLGGGAGYLRLPALVYLIGLPTKTAVGTDLCEVVVSASYGAITHGLKGNVDFPVALAMQAGGVVGARLGARLTTVVRGATLRVSFSPLPIIGAALTILRILRRDAAP